MGVQSDWNYRDYLKILPAIVVAAIIFYFSSIELKFPAGPIIPPSIFETTTILHICEFGLLAICVAFGFYPKVEARFLILFTLIYAVFDEIHQYFVPNRYFDVYDILLDAIGVILGFLFYLILFKLKERLKEEKKGLLIEE